MIDIQISRLDFLSGDQVEVPPAGIVVFVGPNNSGKSEALRSISGKLKNSAVPSRNLSSVWATTAGAEEDVLAWFEENTTRRIDSAGGLNYDSLGHSIHVSHIAATWQRVNHKDQPSMLSMLSSFFVAYLSTEEKLNAANPPPSILTHEEAPKHPIHVMAKDAKIAETLSKAFNEAFGSGIIVNQAAGSQVTLVIGEKEELPKVDAYDLAAVGAALSKLPRVDHQGDGMRSFMGTLLYVLVQRRFLVLIDEPEAFLHPPQARILGKLVGQKTPQDRQIFVATHSADFLKGLLQAAPERVKVVRLDRSRSDYVNQLDSAGISEVGGIHSFVILIFWRVSFMRRSLFANRIPIAGFSRPSWRLSRQQTHEVRT
ncbi:AAA family ATPase [Haloferula sp. BvORR071]|uniref:AAA family ATPase n=1 Tax=Haloferula sp. BvORR071 TaxID=1396141 RepID=UPI0005585579|nr:AAA family ATPase [Haloferula sp. BvORR071]